MNKQNPPPKETDLSRIKWQCRRGLLELDVLLSHFLETQYNQLSHQEKETFSRLLQYSDQELLYWFTNQDIPPVDLADIIHAIKSLPLTRI